MKSETSIANGGGPALIVRLYQAAAELWRTWWYRRRGMTRAAHPPEVARILLGFPRRLVHGATSLRATTVHDTRPHEADGAPATLFNFKF